MKNKALLYYFFFSIVVATVIYVAQKHTINLPNFIRFYVNDFLIIPIVLTICLLAVRWLRNNTTYKLTLTIICYMCLLYSVIFEWVLPKFHPRYTSDIIDVILYFAGGFVFYLLQKK